MMMSFRRCKLAAITVILLVLLASCFALPVEPVGFDPPTFSPPPPREFRTVQAGFGDVRYMTTFSAHYTFVYEVSLSFDQSMLPIYAINVEVGDIVSVGDVVATVGTPGLDEAREEVELEIARILVRLRQAEERHQALLDLAARSGIPVDDSGSIAEILNIIGELEVANLQLGRIGDIYEGASLVSPIDGVVTHAVIHRQGMTSTAGSRVVTVSDQSKRAFVVLAAGVQHLMNIGDYSYVTIGGNEIPLVVVDPDDFGFGGRPEWVNARFLVFAGPHPYVELDSRGPISVVQAEALDVVYLPLDVVRTIGERTFVYVIENGLRQVRDVVVGVTGNTTEEIISGLQPGDEVIR